MGLKKGGAKAPLFYLAGREAEVDMKRIEAVIQAGRFNDVRDQLERAGCLEVLVAEVGESGRHHGPVCSWKQWPGETKPSGRIHLEIMAAAGFVMNIVQAILEGASKNGMGR